MKDKNNTWIIILVVVIIVLLFLYHFVGALFERKEVISASVGLIGEGLVGK